MKHTLKLLPMGVAGFLGFTTISVAALECPSTSASDLKLSTAEISALLPAGDPLDDPAKLDAAIDAMRTQGLGSAGIIDGLIGSYCPIVASDASLTDAQKASRVQSFAARITRLVYAVEGADEIILDVPFSPTVADAINSKAAEAGMSPENWIAKIVDTELTQQP